MKRPDTFYTMFHLHRSSDNQFYFTLRARNGRVLMTSETYKTRQAVSKAMKAISISARTAGVIDHTTPPRINKPSTTLLTTERMVAGKLKVVRVGK